jgi:hypothetical protein
VGVGVEVDVEVGVDVGVDVEVGMDVGVDVEVDVLVLVRLNFERALALAVNSNIASMALCTP